MANEYDEELTAQDLVLLDQLASELGQRDPAPPLPAYVSVLMAFGHERERQLARFGQQHCPDGTGRPGDATIRRHAQQRCQRAAAAGTLTWRDVLDEEIAEAYAETDPDRLEAELTQAGAVIAAWIENLHSRKEHRS